MKKSYRKQETVAMLASSIMRQHKTIEFALSLTHTHEHLFHKPVTTRSITKMQTQK
jgi:hypothetical protein